MNSDRETQTEDIRDFFKRWPKFYYFIGVTFGPLFFGGLSARSYLDKYQQDGMILNIGSGPKLVRPDVVNVDIHPYKGVKIVADVHSIPLSDGSVSLIISDTVLEHLRDPRVAVKEMYRLLKSGGTAYVVMPFLYPFHSSPSDYFRFSKQGALELFADFEVIEIGVRAGPFSALNAHLNHMFAAIFSFGSPQLYSLLLNLVMFLTFPIKLPDIIFNHWPESDTVAALLYCVVKKK